MSRPISKDTLLDAIALEDEKLQSLLKSLTRDQMILSGVCGQWSAKDILAHLYAWQQLVLSWYQAGVRKEVFKTPASDLGWNEIPALNQRIYEQYSAVSLSDIQAKFTAPHDEILMTIKAIPEEELGTPNFYAWTKNTKLLSYFISCTSSHYHWAYDEIRYWIKASGITKNREIYLEQLNESVANLLETYRELANPDVQINETWTAKDVLSHLTFWHESFARNVSDLAMDIKPTPLKGKLNDLNQTGVTEMKPYPLEVILKRFEAAHRTLQENILNPKIVLIPYKKGSRDYSAEEHLEIVRGHINKHLRDVLPAGS